MDLLSDEHFTVDGTLIEAWASTAKSMRRKDGPPNSGGPDDQGMVNIHGERRSNATHTSATDPDAKLMRKSKGKESKLSYGGHALMENRHGPCVDLKVTEALDTETAAAKAMLKRQRRKRVQPSTLGADKGYHSKDFVAHLRRRNIAPHIAMIEGRKTPGLDAHYSPCQLQGEPAQAQACRRDLRLDESLWRVASNAGAWSSPRAAARVPGRRCVQPAAARSIATTDRIGAPIVCAHDSKVTNRRGL